MHFFSPGSHSKVMKISKQITKVSQLRSSLNKNFHLSSKPESVYSVSTMFNSVGGKSETIYPLVCIGINTLQTA